ncbi:MAG TPA: hypothetical protein VJ792_08075 [Candidatus Nitrosotalea sp.]|nr:hypothetical protein [Candidatus Nitrosotalea sp.]
MATKKGIIITAIMLGAIAAGSSVVWIFPQNRGSSIVVSDYGNEIDGVKERHSLIMAEMDSNLKSLLNKTLSPDDFATMAQTSSSQTTSLISELIEANPPPEWRASYLTYDEALKKYNDYLTETISLADKIKSGISSADLSDEVSKIDSLRNDTDSLIAKSSLARP